MRLARVERVINVPRDAVWNLVSDFGHPSRLVPGLAACEVHGCGVGMVRVVRVRGLAVRETLLTIDETRGLLRYEIDPDGDMPLPGLKRFRATVRMRSVDDATTRIRWSVAGEVDRDGDAIRSALDSMYQAGIARIVMLTGC